ncbi:MAG: hypothetical protein DCF22_09840 [Leptolyngbya sp.]|nr:MAG: hypothetical protein DCF22_09840 [Leptolyngbya sp.]
MLTQQSFQQRPFETKIGKIETKESGFEALKQVETHQMALFYTNRCHTPKSLHGAEFCRYGFVFTRGAGMGLRVLGGWERKSELGGCDRLAGFQ